MGKAIIAAAARFARRLRLPVVFPSIVRSVLFTAALVIAVLSGSWFWGFVFFAGALYWYIRSRFEWNTFLFSFLVLTIYAYQSTALLYHAMPGGGWSNDIAVMLAAGIFGILFFLLLGIKEFVFLHRQAIFTVLSGALYIFIAGIFFVADKETAGSFLFYAVMSAVAFYLLLKESSDFSLSDTPKRKRDVLVVGSTLLVAEFLGVIDMLPFGFLNSAVLVGLIVFVLEDLSSHHLRGSLDRQVILNNMTLLFICMLFIVATSKLAP